MEHASTSLKLLFWVFNQKKDNLGIHFILLFVHWSRAKILNECTLVFTLVVKLKSELCLTFNISLYTNIKNKTGIPWLIHIHFIVELFHIIIIHQVVLNFHLATLHNQITKVMQQEVT